jgi:hypothetical protein
LCELECILKHDDGRVCAAKRSLFHARGMTIKTIKAPAINLLHDGVKARSKPPESASPSGAGESGRVPFNRLEPRKNPPPLAAVFWARCEETIARQASRLHSRRAPTAGTEPHVSNASTSICLDMYSCTIRVLEGRMSKQRSCSSCLSAQNHTSLVNHWADVRDLLVTATRRSTTCGPTPSPSGSSKSRSVLRIVYSVYSE